MQKALLQLAKAVGKEVLVTVINEIGKSLLASLNDKNDDNTVA